MSDDPKCNVCGEPKSAHVSTAQGPYTHPREARGEGTYEQVSPGGTQGAYLPGGDDYEIPPTYKFAPNAAQEKSKASGDFSIGSKVWPGASKLLEEMGELQQAIGKLIATAGETAHWDGSDLRARLIEEMADVRAALEFFQAQNFTADDDDRIAARIERKGRLFSDWHTQQDRSR
jgi:hypothetical protein